MWLINVETRKLEAFEGDKIPKYAILSHRWEDEEVTFRDIRKGKPETMKGYYKIDLCCREAQKQNLNAELSEAINSMYKWYQQAKTCYAFLSDVSSDAGDRRPLSKSLWFTRGWTLQELLAPQEVQFFDRSWRAIGSKSILCPELARISGIDRKALHRFEPSRFSIFERMTWATQRVTTREEDRAYCMLGIFEINMPLLYGEGFEAFSRLQQEIIKRSEDRSIFLWGPSITTKHDCAPLSKKGIFASSPSDFLVQKEVRDHKCDGILLQNSELPVEHQEFAMTNAGLRIHHEMVPLYHGIFMTLIGECCCELRQGRQKYYMFLRMEPLFTASSGRFQRVRIDGVSWVVWPLGRNSELPTNTPLLSDIQNSFSRGFTRKQVLISGALHHSSTSALQVKLRLYDGAFDFGWVVGNTISAKVRSNRPKDSYEQQSFKVPLRKSSSFWGCMYKFNSHGQLVVLSFGFLQAEKSPICLVEVFPSTRSRSLGAKFGFSHSIGCQTFNAEKVTDKDILLYDFKRLSDDFKKLSNDNPALRSARFDDEYIVLMLYTSHFLPSCFDLQGAEVEFRETVYEGFPCSYRITAAPTSNATWSHANGTLKALSYSPSLLADNSLSYFSHLGDIIRRLRPVSTSDKMSCTYGPLGA